MRANWNIKNVGTGKPNIALFSLWQNEYLGDVVAHLGNVVALGDVVVKMTF
jgi:hypothetical protein